MEVIKEWRSMNPTGRLLKQNQETNLWYDVGDQKAIQKTSQALKRKLGCTPVDDEQEGSGGHGAVEEIPGEAHTMMPWL